MKVERFYDFLGEGLISVSQEVHYIYFFTDSNNTFYNWYKRSGSITYNGTRLDEFVIQRTAAYISQTDNHIAELTVRETLDFAARCQGANEGLAVYTKELIKLERENNIRPDPEIDAYMKASSVGGKHSITTDYVHKVLGLDLCAETIVGNEMLRGVSGGQRKKVTTGEIAVGPRKAMFMDEISTGLDSSTTYQIVKCIGNFVHHMEATVLMALLQPVLELTCQCCIQLRDSRGMLQVMQQQMQGGAMAAASSCRNAVSGAAAAWNVEMCIKCGRSAAGSAAAT